MWYDCQRDGLTQDIKRHRSSVNNDRALDDLQQWAKQYHIIIL